MAEQFTRENFDEDCPRFIPMNYEDSIPWYVFDTVKLDFLDFIVPYYDIEDCENVCNIINTVDYLLKRDDKE